MGIVQLPDQTHSGIFPDVETYKSESKDDFDFDGDDISHYLGNFMNSDPRDYQELKKRLISKEESLRQVHNSRVGHKGGRNTWTSLNKQFPGHCIPYK